MINLSKRLQAVADLVTSAECIADVGCDHGYIPIYLVEQGICKKAIAMDINRGPLQRAREHIEEHKLGAYIETRLSDGVQALEKGEVQEIVIAGMGGATMQGILEEGAGILEPDTLLVLQPQSELGEFRSYLVSRNFSILAEDMVYEGGKYYPMMKVQKQNTISGPHDGYSETELRYGPLLLARRHPVLKEFLQWQLEHKKAILQQLKQHDRIEEEISYICQALKVYK